LLYFVGLALLVLVLVPGVGREANGAQRWIPLGGFNLQSSEFMKLFMLLYLAGYLNRRQTEVATSVWGFIKPMLPLLIAAALIMLQPDMGTAVVILATAFGMLFLGGVPWRQFAVLIGAAVVSLGTLVWLTPWRMRRVTSFMDPFADPLDSGYQLSNALIALGRGEWFGVGLGESVQKLYYLPEAHNDFLLSVIGEELGFAGVTLIILLFAFIAWRAMRIGVLADDGENRFPVYTAYGCALWIGFQSFVNIGVNLGMMPTKGLTLPFMSYGGNSIIVGMLVIAMLQRIYLENAPEKRREGSAWRTSS
jgi:cell division protein FtsW